MKPFIGSVLLAVWGLVLGWLAPLSSLPAVAVPLRTTLATPMAMAESATLQPQLDRLLRNLPSDYYGIRRPEALKQQLEQQSMLLIDVRETAEYRNGHIKGAINIPLRTLAGNLNQIPKDRPVVLYCSSGYRSGLGVMALQTLGYDNVRGFPPSFEGWQQAGLEIAGAD